MTDVKLQAKEIKNMASELSAVMNELENSRFALASMSVVGGYDVAQFTFMAKRYVEVLEEQSIRLINKLDEVVVFLYNCDNELELQVLRENK